MQLDKYYKDNKHAIKLGIYSASVLGVAITTGTFLQAMAGQPFISSQTQNAVGTIEKTLR